ncbi:MAG: phage head closure protein [Alphaproteobacteria bacterium]|nr:phage head closure protein [Alphaproteobacteria bacterium]
MIGPMRHRVTIESKESVADEGGGVIETWMPVATFWAEIDALGGEEVSSGEGREPRTRYEITMRIEAEVTPAHRLRLGERIFAILAVREDVPQSGYQRITAMQGEPS